MAVHAAAPCASEVSLRLLASGGTTLASLLPAVGCVLLPAVGCVLLPASSCLQTLRRLFTAAALLTQ
jgi:hypothetical protein